MKRRIASIFLAVTMLATLLAGEAQAAEMGSQAEPLRVTAQVDGADICASEVEGAHYLFLPATADLKQLALRVEERDATLRCGEKVFVEGEAFDLTAAGKDAEGRYLLEITVGGKTQTLYVMQGSAIPTLYLTSDDPAEHGRGWVDQSKSNEATGTMRLVDPDGTVIYDGALTQIKPRGNSTFTRYPKKAYQIKLEDKTDLLGIGEKGKTWVLLANYCDATLMHDKLLKDLAAELGMKYVASCDWVDLYYDGEYRGVYTLGEKNSVGSTSVDITDMEEAYAELNPDYGDNETSAAARNAYGQKFFYTKGLTEVADYTGGWLIELNHKEPDEMNGFHTRQNVAFNLKGPEFAGREAVKYISEYYQAFEDAAFATDANGNYTGYNKATGKYYDEYVDLDSLMLAFLLQEFALNSDGFVSSTYFHKDVNGIMYCGPIWDQDNTLGSSWGVIVTPQIKDYRYLQEALIQIPEFEEAVTEYFYRNFLPAAKKLVDVEGTFARCHALLSDSAAMNYVLWPYVRVGSPEEADHLWQEGTDYDAVVSFMIDWTAERLQVLRKRFIPSAPIDMTPEEAVAFPDTAGHWAAKSIRFVAERGLFKGTANGFRPNDPVTQAQMATVLHRMAGTPVVAPDSDAWYGAALGWTDSMGITEENFDADAALTRAQLAVMLYRYAAAAGSDMRVTADLSAFADGGSVTARTAPALEWAVGAGVMRGKSGGILAPDSYVTRAETAVMLERFMNG